MEEEDGGGWSRVEEGGGGWSRMEEVGAGWRRVKEGGNLLSGREHLLKLSISSSTCTNGPWSRQEVRAKRQEVDHLQSKEQLDCVFVVGVYIYIYLLCVCVCVLP